MTHLSILDMKKKIEMYNYVQVCVFYYTRTYVSKLCVSEIIRSLKRPINEYTHTSSQRERVSYTALNRQ